MSETPKMHRRLADRIAAQKAGKSLQIVVPGNCTVCKRRSATVPATRPQAMRYYTATTDSEKFKGFKVYEVRMLTTGVHRNCQTVQDQKARAKAAKAKADAEKEKVVKDIISIAQREHARKVMKARQARAVRAAV